MNFIRVNNAEFNKIDKSKENDVFPQTLIENPQQLIKDALEKFCQNEFKSHFKNPDLMFYIGKFYFRNQILAALIFPYELKQKLNEYILNENGFLKSSRELMDSKRTPSNEDYEIVINFVHDVLYKFSYQKLEKFNSIPELAYLFSKFKRDSKQSECKQN